MRRIGAHRIIQPEILDELPAHDPRAIQSRRDLQKVNAFMGHLRVMTGAMRAAPAPPKLVVELGGGDGTFLLKVARRLRLERPVRAVLVDRRPSLSDETRRGFDERGWQLEACAADVFEWLERPPPEPADVTLANLFLHHFHDPQLRRLLHLTSLQTKRFVSCDPRRSRTALAGVPLLRLVGCNDVTLHDGDLSVRAGFRGRELAALWPRSPEWRLSEARTGLFTHTFIAARD
jgi:hypothetical protein